MMVCMVSMVHVSSGRAYLGGRRWRRGGGGDGVVAEGGPSSSSSFPWDALQPNHKTRHGFLAIVPTVRPSTPPEAPLWQAKPRTGQHDHHHRERESERETWGRAGIDSVCLYGSVPRSATQARPPTHPLEGGYYAATASSLPSSSINHNYMTRGPSSPTTNSLTNR